MSPSNVSFLQQINYSTHLVPEPVGGEVAAVLVADAVVPLVAGVVAALLPLAPVLALDGAGVRRVGRRAAVALPDVHLGAAGAVLA